VLKARCSGGVGGFSGGSFLLGGKAAIVALQSRFDSPGVLGLASLLVKTENFRVEILGWVTESEWFLLPRSSTLGVNRRLKKDLRASPDHQPP